MEYYNSFGYIQQINYIIKWINIPQKTPPVSCEPGHANAHVIVDFEDLLLECRELVRRSF
jgi:hypothetical protein